jgi:hypothetical protein
MAMDEFDDDRLMAELRLLEASEPISELSLELARAAFDMRTMDVELAALVADSALVAGAVRAEGQPRMLSFEGAELGIELEITESGAGRVLAGHLVPPKAAAVELLRPDGERTTVQADERGRFVAELAAPGPVKLVIPSLETDWFVS